MDGVFVLPSGEVIGRIPNRPDGNLVGIPNEGDVVRIDDRPPLRVVRREWYFNSFENRVEVFVSHDRSID